MIMKQNVFIAAALICVAACTTSVQTKPDRSESISGSSGSWELYGDFETGYPEFDSIAESEPILGCWELYDVHYDIKTNYPEIDSIVKEALYERWKEDKKAALMINFFRDKTSQEYDRNGNARGYGDTYNVVGDSLTIQSIIRSDAKYASKIMISNDTLYQELNYDYTLGNLRWFYNIKIPKEDENTKCEKMIRYAIFVRVKDCDQYKE